MHSEARGQNPAARPGGNVFALGWVPFFPCTGLMRAAQDQGTLPARSLPLTLDGCRGLSNGRPHSLPAAGVDPVPLVCLHWPRSKCASGLWASDPHAPEKVCVAHQDRLGWNSRKAKRWGMRSWYPSIPGFDRPPAGHRSLLSFGLWGIQLPYGKAPLQPQGGTYVQTGPSPSAKRAHHTTVEANPSDDFRPSRHLEKPGSRTVCRAPPEV